MPFTSKIKADYVKMINDSLDNITIDSIEDFVLVQQALQLVILSNSQQPTTDIEHQLPEKYKAEILFINAYLKDPEDYVQKETDYDEYKQIIKDRITSKIDELSSLNQEQKRILIQNQSASKAKIAARPVPGTLSAPVPTFFLAKARALPDRHQEHCSEVLIDYMTLEEERGIPIQPLYTNYAVIDDMAREEDRVISIQPRQ